MISHSCHRQQLWPWRHTGGYRSHAGRRITHAIPVAIAIAITIAVTTALPSLSAPSPRVPLFHTIAPRRERPAGSRTNMGRSYTVMSCAISATHTHTQRPLPPLPPSPAPAPPGAEQLPPARVCGVRTVTRPRRCHLPYRQRLYPPPSTPPPPLTTEPCRTMIETFRLETNVI